MFSPSRLHWPSHIRTTPLELGERDLIVYHLGTITRWANIPYGCHGNVLLGRGWSVCQRQFLVVATLLQHPEWWKTQKQYVLYFFYSSILWRCFGFFGRWEEKRMMGTTRKQRGLSRWFWGWWENEEWEDKGGETGREIKLFFVLYLPQRLQEGINLLPPSAGDNSTGAHTHMHTDLAKTYSYLLRTCRCRHKDMLPLHTEQERLRSVT